MKTIKINDDLIKVIESVTDSIVIIRENRSGQNEVLASGLDNDQANQFIKQLLEE